MEVAQAIDITAEQRSTVLALLERHLPGTKAWVYGSRAKWTSTPQSDLDLVVFSKPAQRRQVGDLREAFDESNLPFRVDLFIWSDVPRSFRQQIEAKHVVFRRNDTRSRPALHCRITQKNRILKDLICYTRDGEWGEGASHDDLLPMRVVRGTDFDSVRRGGVAGVPTRHIRRDVAAKKTLRPWDILIETAGGSKNRSTGRTLLVHPRILKDSDSSVTCASFARIVRINPALAHPPYVYWYLQHLYSLGEMERHQVQHTGVARFQFTNFAANVEIPLPSIPEQETIAHILGTLDDRIELNHRMNTTLEAMARALFKSWFVDFDPVRAKMEGRDTGLPKDISDLFPDRLVDSEVGEIPDGWRVTGLGDMIELAYGKPLKAADRRSDGRVPVYGSRGQIGWHDTRLVQGPGIVVGRKGNPGVVTWVPCDFFPIDTTFYVVSKDGNRAFHFLFYALLGQNLPAVDADSAVPGLNRNIAYMNRQIAPAKEVVEYFGTFVSPIFADRDRLNAAAMVIASLRDAMLPKLVAGQLAAIDVNQGRGSH